MSASAQDIRQLVDELYRTQSRRVFATLVRLLGNFELAEEALHDAFAAAVQQWSTDGAPDNPCAWLVSTGRFKAVDMIRRRKRFDASLATIATQVESLAAEPLDADDLSGEDDQLRLIFTCCHPALSPETQIALTLREVCDLRTEEIAAAFLTSPSTIAQRIVRGKAKIRDAGIPFQLPSRAELPDRWDSVLTVVYLVFNEGYSASSGDAHTRPALSQEAIRLGRLLVKLSPDSEAQGLLALMLLQESRRTARTNEQGEIILLEDQDRSLWDRALIVEGQQLIEQIFGAGEVGLYTVQAAIAAVHATAPTAAATDWTRIVALYDLLLRIDSSPIVELNRAVAVAMRDTPADGITLIDDLLRRGHLADYHLTHAARGDLLRRSGARAEARVSYERALRLAKQEPERRLLRRRLEELA